jgi:tetratricopeptide (TPR) repeat protein
LINAKRKPILNEAVTARLIAEGKCGEAMATQINPVLTADPNNQKAKEFRDKCATPPPPPPPPTIPTSVPPTPTAEETLAAAATQIEAKDCAKALEGINSVLAADANNAQARDLFARANACLNPVPPPPTEKLAVKIPPAQGGLDPVPGETDKAYKIRMMSLRKKYDDAVALLQIQKYAQAKRAFDDLTSQIPSGYLEWAKHRDEAIAGMRGEAKNAFEAAQAADKADDFDAAINGYRRAHDLDPGIQVDALMQRATQRKLEFGKKRCETGKLEFSYGNNAVAIPALQDAVKFLPPSDPCYGEARQRLQSIPK